MEKNIHISCYFCKKTTSDPHPRLLTNSRRDDLRDLGVIGADSELHGDPISQGKLGPHQHLMTPSVGAWGGGETGHGKGGVGPQTQGEDNDGRIRKIIWSKYRRERRNRSGVKYILNQRNKQEGKIDVTFPLLHI